MMIEIILDYIIIQASIFRYRLLNKLIWLCYSALMDIEGETCGR